MSNDAILTINQMAKSRQKAGYSVINGSIGMMFGEDGKLPVSPSVRAVLSKHVLDDDLSYSSVRGTDAYLECSRKWFLSGSFDEAARKGLYEGVATLGGTGAVTLSFYLAKQTKSLLLIPSLAWPNYEGVAGGFGLPFEHYDLYEGRSFGLKKLAKQVADGLDKYGRVALLINDPCENPTGYSLEAEEWDAVAGMLSDERYAGRVDLIIDAAYIDYAPAGRRDAMKKAVGQLPKGDACYFCFSYSKTFSFYGLRLGALGIYASELDIAKKRAEAATKEARALWSVPNHMGMNAVSELLQDEETKEALRDEIEENRTLVKKRADLFLKECDEAGLAYYPYKDGFFVTLDCEAERIAKNLMKKDIYLAPIDKRGLRVALCSLSLSKIKGLAEKIKESESE